MKRYEELVKAAGKKLDACEPETATRLLEAAATRRKVLAEHGETPDLKLTEMEEELTEWAKELCRDYPVPAGVKRKPGVLGCGDPHCESCYTKR